MDSHSDLDDLLQAASNRRDVAADDGKSGSRFERLTIDGQPHFLKSLSYETDWIMRLTGDHDHRGFLVWEHGVMQSSPPCIDHAVVAMDLQGDGDAAVLRILMHDRGEWLIPEGDDVVASAIHDQLIDHMAALHAGFWDWSDTIGLTPMTARLRFFAPDNIAAELERDDPPIPVRVAAEGWRALPELAPELATTIAAIHAEPTLLADAMRSTPSTFVHGDWKMGNLGASPDGRTILLDWAYPGEGPGCWDLAWYLALNRARLPESKEAAIDRYTDTLERRSVSTAGWWDRQLALCLLGMTATIGWEKAIGDPDELAWWETHALDAARLL